MRHRQDDLGDDAVDGRVSVGKQGGRPGDGDVSGAGGAGNVAAGELAE
jgi:hypothetical protein